MTATSLAESAGSAASRVLGRKMDSIPFSSYQILLIFILGLVGSPRNRVAKPAN